MGKPAHEPTDELREKVTFLCINGLDHEKIASAIGVSENTLRKHYRHELDNARNEKNACVASSLYQKAINGDVAAQCFWLKTRAGWKETIVQENRDLDKKIIFETDEDNPDETAE